MPPGGSLVQARAKNTRGQLNPKCCYIPDHSLDEVTRTVAVCPIKTSGIPTPTIAGNPITSGNTKDFWPPSTQHG